MEKGTKGEPRDTRGDLPGGKKEERNQLGKNGEKEAASLIVFERISLLMYGQRQLKMLV